MRDMDWIGRHVAEDAHVTLTDVTGAWTVLSVMGPKSRALLQKVSRADFSNEGFPFATIREVGVGYATVLASRRTYMGELGWELYVPVEFAVTVFETLHEAGAEFGLRDAGYYAVESLRLEKGYRAWGRELTPDDTPFQAGLGWAVKLDKPGGFIGQKALVEAKGQAAGAPPGLGGAGGRRAAAVGRRDAAARRQAGRRPQLGGLRPHGGRVGRPGLRETRAMARRSMRRGWRRPASRSILPARASRPSSRCAALRSRRSAHQGLSGLEPRIGELAGRLEDRIGHRGEVAVDALEVADHVHVDRAGLDRFRPALAQAGEVAVGRLGLGLAHGGLLGDQPARQRDVARGEDVQRQPQVLQHAGMEGRAARPCPRARRRSGS